MPDLKHPVHIERLGWFLYLRWGAVAGAMVLLWAGPWMAPMAIQYGKIGTCVLILGILNIFYFIYWKKLKSAQDGLPDFVDKAGFFLHVQMAMDLALLTAMFFFGGGARNPLILFYLFHLAIGSILFTQMESLLYAVLTFALPWALYFSEKAGFLAVNPWPGISGMTDDYERSLLWAYSMATAGLWFFLSRLALDVESKEKELRKTGEKLRSANESLKELDVYKNRFLRQVVLQLKSPAIEMDLDLSTVEKAVPDEDEKSFSAVRTAKSRIHVFLELIDDLTWLSRMEAAGIPLKKEWLNVYETLLGRIQALEGQAAQKGITFQLHGDSQVMLLANPDVFKKVADNLFSNAVKYTPAGKGHVRVEFQSEGNWLFLTVEDKGIGIPPKQQKKLFQEFFRATNAQSAEKFGTGLGLSIVKQALDLHGGRVSLSSRPKEGTTVETRWPLGNLDRAVHPGP